MLCFFLLTLLAKSSTRGGPQSFRAGDEGPSDPDQAGVRYGFGKIMKGTASDSEVPQRKLAAMEYKKVLLGKNRNEIVIAYRQHGTLSKPSAVPIFAKAVFMRTDDFGERARVTCAGACPCL
jgi:hypothetical protein